MSEYARALSTVRTSPRRWAVTGGAGFIGSHLVEALSEAAAWYAKAVPTPGAQVARSAGSHRDCDLEGTPP